MALEEVHGSVTDRADGADVVTSADGFDLRGWQGLRLLMHGEKPLQALAQGQISGARPFKKAARQP